MSDYKGKVIDTCSDCGKRGPMWSGMPYKCKGCSDKMSKSNDIFDEENDSLIDQRDCFYQYLVSELEHDIENDCVNLDYYNKELNANWDLCNQIEKYFQAVTQTKRPDYIYG